MCARITKNHENSSRIIFTKIWIVLIFLMLFWTAAHADEKGTWLCAQTASQRQGKVFWICGMGSGLDESESRKAALANALEQFDMICEASSDCNGQPRSVSPERTECKRDPKGFVSCTRLIIVTLLK